MEPDFPTTTRLHPLVGMATLFPIKGVALFGKGCSLGVDNISL